MTNLVDWDAPIEAINEDGRVVPATQRGGKDTDGDYCVNFDGMSGLYTRPCGEVIGTMWTIRNVPTPDTTRLEKLEAFVAKVVNEKHETVPKWYVALYDEARALLPTDPLLIQAREIVAGEYERSGPLGDQHRAEWAKDCREGAYDTDFAVVCTLAALRSVKASV